MGENYESKIQYFLIFVYLRLYLNMKLNLRFTTRDIYPGDTFHYKQKIIKTSYRGWHYWERLFSIFFMRPFATEWRQSNHFSMQSKMLFRYA